MNEGNKFGLFLNSQEDYRRAESRSSSQADRETNPRQQILDNFKQINRVMTQNYLKRKERERLNINPKFNHNDMQAQKMVNIMQMMHSPRVYNAPC